MNIQDLQKRNCRRAGTRRNQRSRRIAIGSVALAALLGLGAALRPAVRAESPVPAPPCQSTPILIGYWHNFNNQAGFIKLKDVSSQFDVVNIAFATPAAGSTSEIEFNLNTMETESEFIADVQSLHAKGKKVVLSIGGANALIQLKTATDVQAFVSSVGSIVGKFQFDGVDIDFESSSLSLDPGDTDFNNPTTPAIANLIVALHQLKSNFGPDFTISLAPGTYSVQGGFKSYRGGSGVYLPVIYGARDILSYVYVQDYNSGTRYALDGNIYAEGTADFHVAMTEMLLQGFPIAGNTADLFPALRPDQVAFGVPAYQTAKGFTTNDDLERALRYLIEGTSFGGQYQLRSPAGYPSMRGLMTFSINWDAYYSFDLSTAIGPLLHGPEFQHPVISGVAAFHKNLEVTGCGFDRGAIITVNGQDQQTSSDAADPANNLTAIKAIKRAHVAPGESVPVQVRNSDGRLSNVMIYQRPAGTR
jgi:chitinase